jgi:ribosome-binding factor A
MPTRRQAKVARAVKEAVSDAIANHLSDPRIMGLVSVTRVEMSPDLRNGDVYLSIFGGSDADQSKTFTGIAHARSRIQSIVGTRLETKFCPVLRFHVDDKFKKTLETMALIDEAMRQIEEKDLTEQAGQ